MHICCFPCFFFVFCLRSSCHFLSTGCTYVVSPVCVCACTHTHTHVHTHTHTHTHVHTYTHTHTYTQIYRTGRQHAGKNFPFCWLFFLFFNEKGKKANKKANKNKPIKFKKDAEMSFPRHKFWKGVYLLHTAPEHISNTRSNYRGRCSTSCSSISVQKKKRFVLPF